MKHIFTILLSTLFLSTVCAQSTIFGYKTYDGMYTANVTVLTEGDNNHFYAPAIEYGAGTSVLIKGDQNGNIVWQKTLNLNEMGAGITVSQISYHNNYVYVLTENQYPILHYTLAKIDVNGNLTWARTLTPVENYGYHKPSFDFGPTGEIIVAGSNFSNIELFSLNEDGTTNWVRDCSTDSTEYKNPNFDIAACGDGDFMGCCKSGSDMCFYRMNGDGTPEWSKRILEMDMAYTHIKSISRINSNLFIACGYRMPDYMTFDMKGFYTLLDGAGNFISFNLVNEFTEIKNIFPLDNGNLLLVGPTVDYNFGLIEINSSGTIVNSYKTTTATVYPSNYEGVSDINGNLFIGDGGHVQKLDNMSPVECYDYQTTTFTLTGEDPGADPSVPYFVMHPVVGTITVNSAANLQPATLQLAQGCALTTGVNNPLAPNVTVYPTLLTNNDLMFIEHEMTGEVQYQVMDINGKMVTQNILTNSSVRIEGMNAGMYILQLINNGNVVYHSKFMVN